MKIAVIANQGGSGGLMAYLNGILSVRTEHTVNVYCTDALKLSDCAENVNIIRTDYAYESGKEIFLNKPLNPELIKMVDGFNPDIVLFACGWIRKGLEKYPNVMVLHNQLYIDNAAFCQTVTPKSFLPLLGFRCIVRRSIKNADGVIFLSDKSKKDTDKAKLHYKNGKVVYFGLNPIAFADTFRRYDMHEPVRLLYVSSFHKYKNHDSLFGAVKILKDGGYKIHLDLIGNGPKNREDELKVLAKTLEIEDNINFCGWKSQEEVFAAMDDSDIFVYPSAVESTGLGVMEAMARGMYIACSNMSCMPDVLKKFGMYFDPKLEQGIANALEMLIKSPCVCGEIASEAAEYAKRYTWENAVKGHCEFFEELRSRV